MKKQQNIYLALPILLVVIVLGGLFVHTKLNTDTDVTIPEVTLSGSTTPVEPKPPVLSEEDKQRIIKATLEKKPGLDGLVDIHNRFSHEVFQSLQCSDFEGDAQQYCNEQKAYITTISEHIYWSQVIEKGTQYAETFDCGLLSFESDRESCEQFQRITWSSVVRKGYEYAETFNCDLIETQEGAQLCKDFQADN